MSILTESISKWTTTVAVADLGIMTLYRRNSRCRNSAHGEALNSRASQGIARSCSRIYR
ncbi:hypothetical protein JOD97_001103 [Duganella sp. 1411]|nr:hypothetical protein [Duganella sp. 1411]